MCHYSIGKTACDQDQSSLHSSVSLNTVLRSRCMILRKLLQARLRSPHNALHSPSLFCFFLQEIEAVRFEMDEKKLSELLSEVSKIEQAIDSYAQSS